MLSKPPEFHSYTTKLLLLGILAACMCVFTAGTVLAAKPTDKPCKGSKCDTPLPASPDNYVFWGFDEGSSVFFEFVPDGDDPRTCSLAQVAPDFSSGTYDCVLNGFYVSYDFGNIESCTAIYFAKSNDWYCDPSRHDWFYNMPNLQYSYSWTGDCTSTEGCEVVIVNRINMATTSSPLYSAITMEAYAGGVTTTDGDPNPFSEAQDLAIDYVHVTKFAPKGKDKVLAICEAVPYEGTLTFHTSLVPVTPD